jgi:ribosome-associated translation inhibitor RaiA
VKIQIRERSVPLTEAERSDVEGRLAFTLARFSDRIAKVVVRLSDVGGGGATGMLDKRCQIDVDIRPQTLHVEDEDANLLAAFNRATGRLARAVARALEHERE